MTENTPTKLIIDVSKPVNHPEREKIVALSAEEISAGEAADAAEKETQENQAVAAQALADLKASAKAKLIAGEPLTAEEADTLVI
jgi:hypothetical protein